MTLAMRHALRVGGAEKRRSAPYNVARKRSDGARMAGNRAESAAAQGQLLVLGVGASAGGLAAFQSLLTGLGATPNMAIVFVQHLDPSAKSLLPELLRKSTPMTVHEVTSRRKLKPNTVYVCPPQSTLEVRTEYVCRTDPDGASETGVIDRMLHSIAEHRGDYGVGVVLSGAGSDGTLGLKALSDSGGLTLAQDAQTAEYESMPRSAATIGVADHVLPPEEMAQELLKYARHMQGLAADSSAEDTQSGIESAIPAIAKRLMAVTGHNFQHYKSNTLVRRIQRRMQVLKIARAKDYLGYLSNSESEAQALFRELLIGVTAFFRDPDAFAAIQKRVLTEQFSQRASDDCLRIWIAGCANGAEAYTVAMLCRELMQEAKNPCAVQIFATDIDERALQIARSGVYPAAIAEQVSSERLRKFFVKRGKSYHIAKEIRELVLFSAHNLISDPPFSRQDLILCRNLLIYLGPHLQNKLIPLFHFALRPGGYLVLGPSETISSHAELFRPVDARHRISQRKGTAIRNAPLAGLARGERKDTAASPEQPEEIADLTAVAQRIVLDEFAPKYAVVDDAGQIRNASPGIEKYLRIGGGDYQNNIVKMASSGLRLGLRAAMSKARESRRRVEHDNLSIAIGERIQKVMLTVQPMPRLGEDDPLHMVVFHDVGLPVRRDEGDQPSSGEQPGSESIASQLEQELEQTRTDLDRSLQDMEAANEELKSSNEELLSMNEELQSANEELETSKEEIRAGSDAVARANDDLENLLRSTQIATVFLDGNLCIRSFTPAIADIYELIPTDVGRPLEQFVPAAADMPPLPAPGSLHESEPVEHTVRANSGKTYMRRTLPYRSHAGEADGVVVTFTDISDLRKSEASLERSLIAGRMDAFQTDLTAGTMQRRGALTSELELSAEIVVEDYFERVHRDDLVALKNKLQSATPQRSAYSHTYRFRVAAGEYVWLRDSAKVSFDDGGKPLRVTGTCQDVTAEQTYRLQLEARERQLAAALDRFDVALTTSDAAAWTWDADADMPVVSDTMKRMFGFAEDEKPAFEEFTARFHAEDRDRVTAANLKVMREGGEYRQEYRISLPSGEVRWLRAAGKAIIDEAGALEDFFGVAVDVTEEKNRLLELESREAELRRVIDNMLNFVGVLDSEGTLLEANRTAVAAAGIDRGDVIGKPFWECYWWSYDSAVAAKLRKAVGEALRGVTVRYDTEVRMAGGNLMTIDFMLVPVPDADGKITHLIPSGVDISERKAAERKLAELSERLKLGVEVAQFGLAEIDYTTNTVMLSAEAARLYGLGDSDTTVSRDALHATFHPHDRQRVDAIIEDCLGAGEDRVMATEHRILLSDGGVRWLDVRKQVFCAADSDGVSPRRASLAAHDITKRKTHELELAESRKRLIEAMSAARMGSFTWNRDTDETEWDAQWCDAVGLPHDVQRTGENFFRLVHPDDLIRLKDVTNRSLHSGDGYKHEFRIVRPDGETRWLAAVGDWIHESDGAPRRLTGLNWDITEQKQLEHQLRLNEERLRIAAGAAGFGTFHIDLDQGLAFWSAEFRSLVGLPPTDQTEPQIGVVPSFVYPADREKVADFMERVLSDTTQNDHSLDHRIVHPDGTVRHVRMQCRSLFDTNGDATAIRSIIGTLLDITQQRRYERTLKKERRRAEEASDSKSEFVANMSHEIRTPMTAVLGYTDLLLTQEQDQRKLDHLRTIKRNGNFLLEIINDILDLSKIEAGKVEVEREKFSPQQLLGDVRSMMQVRATEKGLDFIVDYADAIPEIIDSDPKRLKQILVNLVGNAIKFTEHGRVAVTVRFLTSPYDQLQFEVSDTGIGIAEDQREQLFEPFTQGDNSGSRRYGGTGLGLAISHRLAKMLGGGIAIDGAVGQGSKFTLSIATGPIDSSSLILPADGAVDDQGIDVSDVAELNRHVLIVDDQKDIRELAKRFLLLAKATVSEAEDGEAALAHVTRALAGEVSLPDAILLDMQMPRLDGYETARKLRELGFDRPLIALTADAMHGDMDRCLQSGCDAYLAKPINPQDMLASLRVRTDEKDGGKPKKTESRVLIVEDNADAAEALRRLLQAHSISSLVAHTGAAALEAVSEAPPAIVILDLTLQDMTGYEVLNSLKGRAGLEHTRYIALTGHTDPADVERCRREGFHHHVAKPIDMVRLLSLINATD